SQGTQYTWEPIPDDMLALANEKREKMIEACADVDEAIMEKFLEGDLSKITNDELYAALRKATLTFEFVPVLCGSAFKNKGVQLALDAICSLLPSPLDIPPVEGVDVEKGEKVIQRKASDDEPFAALAFKIA